MTAIAKRTTIYLAPKIHKLLKLKAFETSRSISDIISEAVQHELADDAEDIQALEDRAAEPTISYASLLKELKANGKI